MHFIPAGREIPEPLFMAEAVNLSVCGHPSADTPLFTNADGELIWGLPWRGADPQKLMRQYMLGLNAILEALRAERLKAYAQSPASGAFVRIPRLYWFQDRSTSLSGGTYILAEDAGELSGQPVLVANDHLDDWRSVATAALQEAMPTEPEAAGTMTVRVRVRDTPRRRALRKFLAYYDSLENPLVAPEGDRFRSMYETWCAKQNLPRYGRSAFYERLREVRSASTLESTNDNKG